MNHEHHLPQSDHLGSLCHWWRPGTLLNHPNRNAWPRLVRELDDIEVLPETECTLDEARSYCPSYTLEGLQFWGSLVTECEKIEAGVIEPPTPEQYRRILAQAATFGEHSLNAAVRWIRNAIAKRKVHVANLN